MHAGQMPCEKTASVRCITYCSIGRHAPSVSRMRLQLAQIGRRLAQGLRICQRIISLSERTFQGGFAFSQDGYISDVYRKSTHHAIDAIGRIGLRCFSDLAPW